MIPIIAAAKFAAFVWYKHDKVDSPSTRASALRFADSHWLAFLPNAHEGMGRLLVKLAEQPATRVGVSGTRRPWRTDAARPLRRAMPVPAAGVA